jgi:serine/threonine protein kinase
MTGKTIMIGQTLSHYRIIEKLGEGGMGVVYKAEDTRLKRLVALKMLPPHLPADKTGRARFIQEARAAAVLNHPNVCTVYDVEDQEPPFIVMEYIEGMTLRELIRSTVPGGLSTREVLKIAMQAAGAIQAAHEQGIVHRDIKSDNLMIAKNGRVKVMDFGVAKLKGAAGLTRTGSGSRCPVRCVFVWSDAL